MGAARKFLFLFISIVALQEICAWPRFNIIIWKNIGYEINKVADDAERDVRKDLLNVKNNIWKDASKWLKKARENEPVVTCIIETQREYLMKVDDTSVKALQCIETIRAEADAVESEEFTSRELSAMKNEFKGKVKACRNEAKDNLKASQKEFSKGASDCTRDPTRVPSLEDAEEVYF